jgi:hypothetical protein
MFFFSPHYNFHDFLCVTFSQQQRWRGENEAMNIHACMGVAGKIGIFLDFLVMLYTY